MGGQCLTQNTNNKDPIPMNATTTTLNFTESESILTPLLNLVDRRQTSTRGHKIVYTNEAIIYGLKARDEKVISYIYKQSYAQVRFFITSNNGTVMDAEDIFQDALVLIYKNIASEKFVLTCSFSTYLFSICRHLWLQKLNRNLRNVSIDDNMTSCDPFEDEEKLKDHLMESEKYRLFQKHFNRLKAGEQKILKLYMSKTHGREVASIMGYKSDKYAKYRKYVIKEKLKAMIMSDELYDKVCSLNN